MGLLAELLAVEHQVWDALVRGDQDADRALLAADFLGVYADGFADRAAHVGQLQRGPSVRRYTIDTPQARALGSEHAVLSYRAEFVRAGLDDDERSPEVMYVSSIWQRCAGGWINVFSQDTAAQAG